MPLGSTMFMLLSEPPKVKLYGVDGSVKGELSLPPVYGLPVRKDLIRRAFLAAFTARLQPKGRDPLAGKRTTARSFGVGLGIARVPRIPGLGRAAFINSAVGGHLAFPPTPMKKLREEINKKEMRLAVASALAATARPEMVRARGHVFTAETLPVVVEDEAERVIVRTRDVKALLDKLGLWPDIERAMKRKRWRAGKGKMRGRRYVVPKTVLFIVSNHRSPLARAASVLPGVDIAEPELVNIKHLAPGGEPGRLTLVTASALERLAERFKDVVSW